MRTPSPGSFGCCQDERDLETGTLILFFRSQTPGEPGGAMGVVSLEDIIEEMIGEEVRLFFLLLLELSAEEPQLTTLPRLQIVDETDLYIVRPLAFRVAEAQSIDDALLVAQDIHAKTKVVRAPARKQAAGAGKQLAPLIAGASRLSLSLSRTLLLPVLTLLLVRRCHRAPSSSPSAKHGRPARLVRPARQRLHDGRAQHARSRRRPGVGLRQGARARRRRARAAAGQRRDDAAQEGREPCAHRRAAQPEHAAPVDGGRAHAAHTAEQQERRSGLAVPAPPCPSLLPSPAQTLLAQSNCFSSSLSPLLAFCRACRLCSSQLGMKSLCDRPWSPLREIVRLEEADVDSSRSTSLGMPSFSTSRSA